jgi:hypothetical protein
MDPARRAVGKKPYSDVGRPKSLAFPGCLRPANGAFAELELELALCARAPSRLRSGIKLTFCCSLVLQTEERVAGRTRSPFAHERKSAMSFPIEWGEIRGTGGAGRDVSATPGKSRGLV